MKYFRLAAILISFFLLIPINAQTDFQFHISGGLVSPFNSTRGASAIGKIQYNFSEKFSAYFSSGYLSYGNYNLVYEVNNERKKTVDELDHEVVPILFGGRYTAVNSTTWHPFVEVELGLSVYNYRTGDIVARYDPDTGDLVQFDRVNERNENKVLTSYGVGLGITHKITQSFGTEIGLKLNSNLDDRYSILLGGRGTYTTVYWGFILYFV